MKVDILRQVHGKFGMLMGRVDVPDHYGTELVNRGLAKPAPKAKKKTKSD